MKNKIEKSPRLMGNVKYSLLWATRAISFDAAVAVFAYTTFFMTDVLHCSATTVGWLLILAKVLDSVTDFLVGYLIDRTDTRLGKARPYELAIIGYWGAGILLFACPAGTERFLLVFFFIMYNLRQSVFSTFLACGEPVYFANSIPDKSKATSALAIRGVISGIVSFGITVILPSFVDAAGTNQGEWIKLGLIFGIPFTVIGLLRFLFIPELRKQSMQERDKFSIIGGVKLLLQNKYLLFYCGSLIATYFAYNLTSNSTMYYAKYVFGDGGLGIYISATMASGMIVTLLMPLGSKKLGRNNFVKLTLVVALVGYLGRLINPYSVVMQFIFGFMANCAIMPFWGMISAYLMDCMDYGEWKTGVRAEGMVTSIYGIAQKIGIAVGMGAVGLILGAFGYDAALAVQPQSAVNAIISIFTWIPAILVFLALVCLHFYKLDEKLPAIHKDLAARKGVK